MIGAPASLLSAMDTEEIEELAALGQAVAEIDRLYADPDAMTMKQLGELETKYRLSTVKVMAAIALVRWGRMYVQLLNMPCRAAEHAPGHAAAIERRHPVRDLEPPALFSEGDEIVDFAEVERKEQSRIEFL